MELERVLTGCSAFELEPRHLLAGAGRIVCSWKVKNRTGTLGVPECNLVGPWMFISRPVGQCLGLGPRRVRPKRIPLHMIIPETGNLLTGMSVIITTCKYTCTHACIPTSFMSGLLARCCCMCKKCANIDAPCLFRDRPALFGRIPERDVPESISSHRLLEEIV